MDEGEYTGISRETGALMFTISNAHIVFNRVLRMIPDIYVQRCGTIHRQGLNYWEKRFMIHKSTRR